ncbi:endonuclease/exonuclease/phosphatase family protein [Pseudooceanicola sp. LIPI14-2-Ac024]|uniref:endonuclease/exonuclease/phosphatase family protein n=1 Tax=Pseudooceanicola sp. LIPI14-2-Ac024 TaxID=3344875 RepID=UPI0035D04B22
MLTFQPARADGLRVAFFHTELARDGPGLLLRDIAAADPQVLALRRVIDAAAADVLVLAGVDYDAEGRALAALNAGLAEPYPALLPLAGNTGIDTGIDLDGDGRLGSAGDRQAFGRFPGQSGLAVLSRLPIRHAGVRSLNDLLWRDLPGSLIVDVAGQVGAAAQGSAVQRLSSGGHWIVPLDAPGGRVLSLMAFHASPPVFDGPEDRNGRRNADEIRLWQLLLDGAMATPPPDPPFILLGAANADPSDGDGQRDAIRGLLADPRLQDPAPRSVGGDLAGGEAQSGDPALDTADWGEPVPGNLRVDYVLPSATLTVTGSGVLWPPLGDPLAQAVLDASRHRLVWVDIAW